MSKFDLSSAKYAVIMLAIILIFILFVANAYKYLPSDKNEGPKIQQNEELYINEYQNVKSEEPESQKIYETSSIKDSKVEAETELRPDVPPVTIEGETVSNSNASMEQANKYMLEKDYVNALLTYKEIADNSSDVKLKADCYEKMAIIYGISKKYGTALAFSQKAFNLSPNSSREMLLARLYYKLGEVDKASERVNYILKRDFIPEQE